MTFVHWKLYYEYIKYYICSNVYTSSKCYSCLIFDTSTPAACLILLFQHKPFYGPAWDTAAASPARPARGPRTPRSRLRRGRCASPIGQTLEGSFSAVSKPNFASKYALESSRRDLHNALLCTVLNAQNFRQKSLKNLLFFSPNLFNKFSLDFAQILPDSFN